MARTKVEGRCRLCSKWGRLSFEHVPPESAFNDSGVLLETLGQWLASERGGKERGTYRQRGLGAYTLCERCNNNTGRWYASEYVIWAKRLMPIVADVSPSLIPAHLAIRDRYPLRLIKQVVTMFLAVGSEEFSEKHPALRHFALNWQTTHLPPTYEFYMNLYRGPEVRTIPLAGRMNPTGLAVLGEVAFPPLAFVMTFEMPPRDIPGRITGFASHLPNQKADVLIPVILAEGHTIYPEDYRSKAELERQAREGDAQLGDIRRRLAQT